MKQGLRPPHAPAPRGAGKHGAVQHGAIRHGTAHHGVAQRGLGLPEALLALALIGLAILITMKSQQHLQFAREQAAQHARARMVAQQVIESLRAAAMGRAPWICPEALPARAPHGVLTLRAQASPWPGVFHVQVEASGHAPEQAAAAALTLQTLLAPHPSTVQPAPDLHCRYSF
jgi:hypothetical protein